MAPDGFAKKTPILIKLNESVEIFWKVEKATYHPKEQIGKNIIGRVICRKQCIRTVKDVILLWCWDSGPLLTSEPTLMRRRSDDFWRARK